MGNLSLYVAREPPSTSLATVLTLKDQVSIFNETAEILPPKPLPKSK
jgi:hypothetical protein